jgi:predicted tellurium resistance membrane protein TerC
VDVAHAAVIKTTLIVFGLATSVPLIIAGSALLMMLLERFPILVWAGAALLGWVAGDIMIKDDALLHVLSPAVIEQLHYWAAAAGAVFVIAVGYIMLKMRRPSAEVTDV